MHTPKPADIHPHATPVIVQLAERWSSRAFADEPIADADLLSLMEAARWSASSYNEQPWRFLIATQDDEATYAKAIDCVMDMNRAWAATAPVLLVTFVKKTLTLNGKPNPAAQHDLGLAIGSLSAQATHLGINLHQMGGVFHDQIHEAFAVPDDFHAFTIIALGYPGDPSTLTDERLLEAESAARQRHAIDALVFGEAFGKPYGFEFESDFESESDSEDFDHSDEFDEDEEQDDEA